MNPAHHITAQDVLACLQYHYGRANGISGAALTLAVGLPAGQDRVVRRLITELRLAGKAIVGTPETGYFMAQTQAELHEFAKFHRSRALHELTILSRVLKISIPELAGQLSLLESKAA